MSLRRRVAIVFLLVNALTLGGLSTYILLETNQFKERIEKEQQDIRDRSVRLWAAELARNLEVELRSSLNRSRLSDDATIRRTISDQKWWDNDAFVRQHLEKAVLVRFTEHSDTDTVLFNPRPRLIFEEGRIDRRGIREAVEDTGDMRVLGSSIIVGRVPLEGAKTWGFYFRMRRPPGGDVDPAREVRNVLILTVPGMAILLGFIYFFVSSSVVRPVASMGEAAKRISAGDFTVPVDDGGRTDELGALARTLNETMVQLADYRNRMEGLVAEATEKFKKAERHLILTQRLAAMGQLAAGIAHEINNPLAGTLNALQKLADERLDPERRQRYFRLAHDAVQRIQEIVQRVLSSAPRNVKPEVLRLAHVVEQAVGLVRHRAQKESVEIVLDLDAGLRVLGTANELIQVFLNLFINACDAIGGGGGRITVRARPAGEWIDIAVADTGSGMSDEVKEHIFDLFFTTKPGTQGTGLGLGIVHNIVATHGGTIAVQTAVGRGTTFNFNLPAAPPVA
jgi:signal transduction histidine kinase